MTFVQGPKVCRLVAHGLEDKIPSVRRPVTTTFVGCAVPTRKQGTKMAAVRGNLPDGTVVGLGIVQCKTQNRPVGRPAEIARGSSRQQEPARFTAITRRQQYLVSFAVGHPLPVRRPRTGVTLKAAQSTGRTAKHRDAPKRAVERRPSGCIHQKRRTVGRDIENVGKASVLQGGGYGKRFAAIHGGLGKARLALDEVKPRTVRDYA